MAESNVGKIANILLAPNNTLNKSVSKKDSETVTLGKIYNFLVKDREEKGKRQQRLQQRQRQYGIQSASTITDATSPTATIVPKDKKDGGGMFGGLGMLGIVAAGVGVYVFSDEIKQKINEIKEYFEETTWTDAFQKFEDLFDFSDLLDEIGLGPISESVSRGSDISKFDTVQLNILTKGGKELLSESEFKQIQSQHSALSGMNFGDVSANIAAQGFKASDIQRQLGTSDIEQTVAAEKIGVESTKKLYAAKSTQKATEVVSPEVARSNRNIFYKDTGEERTVGEVREQFAAQSRPPLRPAERLSSRSGSVSRKQVYDYIRSKGVGHNHAMGMLANIEGESGFRPGVIGDHGTSGGLFQWHDSRFTKMQQSIPDWQTNWKAQIDYALKDKEGFVDNYFGTQYSSAEEATTGWVQYFERLQNPVADSAKRRSFIPALEREISTGVGDVSQSGLISIQPTTFNIPTSTDGVTSGLQFAPGVDNRITSAISDRMKLIQNVFGKRLTITSGYRDAARNKKVGGATKSAHLRGNAVDISTAGMSKEDQLKLIQIASAVGIGGIGVYDNALHFDVEGRRAWGHSYSITSLPQWASGVIAGHMSGQYVGSLANITPIEQSVSSTPTSPLPNLIPTQSRKPKSSGGTVVVNNNQVLVSTTKTTKTLELNKHQDAPPHNQLLVA